MVLRIHMEFMFQVQQYNDIHTPVMGASLGLKPVHEWKVLTHQDIPGWCTSPNIPDLNHTKVLTDVSLFRFGYILL